MSANTDFVRGGVLVAEIHEVLTRNVLPNTAEEIVGEVSVETTVSEVEDMLRELESAEYVVRVESEYTESREGVFWTWQELHSYLEDAATWMDQVGILDDISDDTSEWSDAEKLAYIITTVDWIDMSPDVENTQMRLVDDLAEDFGQPLFRERE